ncbi:hypothetical protein [Acidipila sp. EB88]|uniref:hypothetical protein n=1 Tax=Acidipila sp. EB88 TaxID=2305226 RepID=UPI000F5F5712|nr:hypothetical protein [Acidipila sp. EB88]RRA47908.1 hypothetical protein D1Y84_05985 [Acidipila sp. EB88]
MKSPFPNAVASTGNVFTQATCSVIFWTLFLLLQACIFLHPVFPTGDGPLHIYLAAAFWKAATHTSPLFEHFYAVRHLVQPYSLHYFFLIGLEHWVSADMAEKLFVSVIVGTLAFGGRQLGRALGSGFAYTSLWGLALVFNWPLSAGFLNFTLASGLFLFALCFYYELALKPEQWMRAMGAFFVVLVLLILSHPLPLMLMIFLLGVDLALQLLGRWRNSKKNPGSTPSLNKWQFACFALSCLAFVFPILIADKAQVAQSVNGGLQLHFEYLRSIAGATYVRMFLVHSVLGWLYDGLISLILPAALVLFAMSGVLRRLRTGLLLPADRLMLGVLLYLLATLFFPDQMNGSALFARRQWFMVWLLLPATAAGVMNGRVRSDVVSGGGMLAAGLALVFAGLYLGPAAHEQWALEHAPLPEHARGLFLQSDRGWTPGGASQMMYPVFAWEGGRAFAAHDDVLMNTPWLQLTILPIRENGAAGLMRDFSPGLASEQGTYSRKFLATHAEAAAEILKRTDFLLLSDPNTPTPQPLAIAQTALGAGYAEWHCVQAGTYAVCTHPAPHP